MIRNIVLAVVALAVAGLAWERREVHAIYHDQRVIVPPMPTVLPPIPVMDHEPRRFLL